jgi:transposase
VLLAAEGQRDKDIAAALAMTPKKVSRWRKRFLALGVAGLLQDAPRPGRKPTIPACLRQRAVTLTTRQQPNNATQWSTRTMAAAVGISKASVRRIWRAHGLKPHRVESFKISNETWSPTVVEFRTGAVLGPRGILSPRNVRKARTSWASDKDLWKFANSFTLSCAVTH